MLSFGIRCTVNINYKICRCFSSFPFSTISLTSDQNFSHLFHELGFIKNKTYVRNLMDLKSVVKVIETALPPELAEKWDKTGLLIEPPDNIQVSSIFFTIDLTEKVLEEAISLNTNLIIAYHPPIFSPIFKLQSDKWKDRIVMKCIKNSIALYSPHTVCDVINGGVNDWLLNCFDVSDVNAVETRQDISDKHFIYEFTLPNSVNLDNFLKNLVEFEVLFVTNSKGKHYVSLSSSLPAAHGLNVLTSQDGVEFVSVKSSSRVSPSKGIGRITKLKEAKKLGDCIKLVKNYLNLEHLRFALGVDHSLDTQVKTIAVCGGSGASVLKGVEADLYLTGEMSHHDLLDATSRNVSIILAEHSNTERGYLRNLIALLQPQLRNVKLNLSMTDKDPVSVI